MRLRSDQQLVALFREGNEDAFRVIHDRYRPRLLAYVRQMLPGRPADAEDALQDVFLRTYAALRTGEREFALRPWLYRVAHNRCIDELRRPLPVLELLEAHDRASDRDPAAETEQREALQRLVTDIGRLPEQQRSALLMRELSGMAYSDVADALSVSVPAVKSLLVRARIGLTQAVDARDTACVEIRSELAEALDQGVRPSWMARRHMRDCPGCRACRTEMRATSRRVAALVPAIGPVAMLAQLLGIGTGASGGTATAAGAGSATAAGAGGTATAATGLATVSVGHVATILAAAVVTAGGAVAVQQTVATHSSKPAKPLTHHPAAASAVMPTGAVVRMHPVTLAPAPAAAPPKASSPRHALPAASSSTASTAERAGADRVVRPSLHSPTDVAGTTAAASAASTATTCTPPPAACTASATTTCPASSGSTTTDGSQTTTGTTSGKTTGSGTTSGNTTGSASTTGSTGTSTGTTGGTTSGTTSGSTTGSTVPACSTTTQSTGTQGTPPTGQTGTGQTGTTQPAKLT